MKKFHKKSLVLLVCVTLLLTFTVSGTVAFLADNSGPVTNTFTPVEVDTKIVETFKDDAKTGIFVENIDATNHIPVYVRVTLGGYWINEKGQIVGPWDGVISYNSTNWTKVTHEDGLVCYYYKGELPVGQKTENLLVAHIDQASYTGDEKPEGATRLIVTVVHQSIQSQPDAAIKAAWGNDALGYVKK